MEKMLKIYLKKNYAKLSRVGTQKPKNLNMKKHT